MSILLTAKVKRARIDQIAWQRYGILPRSKEMKIKEIVGVLGRAGYDKVTGARGVVTSVSFDVEGDIRFCLTPHHVDDISRPPPQIKPEDMLWIGIRRLVLVDKRVMDAPAFKLDAIATR